MSPVREAFYQLVSKTFTSQELRQMAEFEDEAFAASLPGGSASRSEVADSFVDGALKRDLVGPLVERFKRERERNNLVADFANLWDEHTNKSSPSSAPVSVKAAALIDFRAERGRHKHFVGRESILRKLDEWIDDPRRESGYVLLTGSPGVGKSAIVSRWLESRGQGLDKAKHEIVIPHHFIRDHSDWEKPDVIVENIVAQLECKFGVQADPDLPPYRRLGEFLNELSADHLAGARLVIVLDGLDEARTPGQDGNPLRSFIPASLPVGVVVLCASRPEYPNLQWLEQRDGVRRLDLDLDQESNQETVREFWRARGGELTPPLSPEFVAEVVERAGGNMLFSVRYWEDLGNTPADERSIDAIPRGIDAFLEGIWLRVVQSPEPQQSYLRDGLGILAVAREALPLQLLDTIAGWPADEAFLQVARPFLLSEPGRWHGHRSDAYRPYHERFREFLIGKLGASLETYHRRIIEQLAVWPPEATKDFEKRYTIQHGVFHRLAVDPILAFRMASDPKYWFPCIELRGLYALELDLGRVTELLSNQTDEGKRARLLERCVRQESHWLRQEPKFAEGTLYNRLVDATGSRAMTETFWRGRSLPPIRLTRALQHADDAIRVLQGHSDSVNACAVTPDGRHIVSASDDHTLRVWPLEGGDPRVLKGHSDSVNACAVTPDGRHIVSASSDGTLRVWPLKGGAARVLKGHEGSVHTCAVTPGGDIVSASFDRTLRVWPSLGRGETLVLALTDLSNIVLACAVVPDGRIVSAYFDGTLRVWPLEGGAPRVLKGHEGSVSACAVTPDGRIVSASDDHTLRVWPLEGGDPRVLEGRSGPVRACAVTPDGRIVSAYFDGTLRVWPLDRGEPRVLEGHSDMVNACTVTKDGHIVSASSDGTLRIFNKQGTVKRMPEGHSQRVRGCAVTPDGRHIVSISDDGSLRVWPQDGGEPRLLESHPGAFAVTVLRLRGSPHSDQRVSPLDGSESRVLEGHLGWVQESVTPDGRHIVSASGDGTLRVWPLLEEGEPRILEGHLVNACAVTPDGRHIVSASDDRTISFWDFESGECIYTVFGREPFTCIDVSSPVLAAGDSRGNVWIFEVDPYLVGPPVSPLPLPEASPEPEPEDTPTLYRTLLRNYSGALGSKVFLLALLTLAPLGIGLKSELVGLKLSVATLVYVAYHSFGIYIWAGVYQLRNVPGFTDDERDAEIQKLHSLHRIVKPLGWAVLILLGLTAVAKAELVFGEHSVSASGLVPQWLRDLLGA